jgi:uncharacterized protein (UPF0264 family)
LAGLLVSVRSADEAEAAVAGGASVVDVKEPTRGPLGCAEPRVWQEVRAVVPRALPVSVALGELGEWLGCAPRRPDGPEAFAAIAYRKLGLAHAGVGWEDEWAALRRRLGPGPPWIAVVYADWKGAGAPHPDAVREAALATADCAGILIDTWDKSQPSPLADDATWRRWFAAVRRQRPLLIAVAGGLDRQAIVRLAPLRPDLFAVRGAACIGGDRRGTIDGSRVAGLVEAINDLPHPPGHTAPHRRSRAHRSPGWR